MRKFLIPIPKSGPVGGCQKHTFLNQFPAGRHHGQVTADVRGGTARRWDRFRVGDDTPGMRRARTALVRIGRYTTMWSRSDSHSKLSPRHLGTATLIPCGKGCSQHLCSSHAEGMPVSGKPTFHSESDRDAIDHVRIIGRMGISQQLSEWQHVSVCKLHNQADRLRVRRDPGTTAKG